MKGVSVIICCYNSAKRIEETLKCLWKQKSTVPFEIILVDNNCSDKTSDLAYDCWLNSGKQVSFKIVKQPVPGLSYAREKGISEAAYNYLIFCDDDNSLDENYIGSVYEIFEKDKKVGVIGGMSEFYCEQKTEDWLTPLTPSFACGKQWTESTNLSGKRDFVWGAGMCLRKDILEMIEQTGIKSLLTGRKGGKLLSGDDTELCYWISKLGYKIIYSEDLKFIHRIDARRTNWEYLIEMYHGFGVSNAYLFLYEYHFFNKYSMISGFPIRLKKRTWHNYLFFYPLWLQLVWNHFKHLKKIKKRLKGNPDLLKKGSGPYLSFIQHKAILHEIIRMLLKFYLLNRTIKKYSSLLSQKAL